MQELQVTQYPNVFSVIHQPGLLIVDRWTVATLRFEVQDLGAIEIDVDEISVKRDPQDDQNTTRVKIQGRLDDASVELRFSVAVERIPGSTPNQERKRYHFSRGMLFIK